ncbi:hypothetical protein AB6A40_011525 [Gnathostoma spinigerum]|uniref:Acyl-coenzyme A oxidase N-terminal domain-containing protein n=1 Tax=Gnathostoma spinigerum TaxID=75299 RepID=A0ABD6EY19_9BILA
MKANLIEPGDNEDITDERRSATFDISKLAAFIHGSEHHLRRRSKIVDFVSSKQELLDRIPPAFMSRQQRIENSMRKAVALQDFSEVIDRSDFSGEGMLYQRYTP